MRALALSLVLASAPALAVEQDVRLRADYFHLTAGQDGGPGAQLFGYGLRARLVDLAPLPAGVLELGVEGRAREDLARERGTWRGLSEARLTLRDVGAFSVTAGRFGFGEGIAVLRVDGGEVAAQVHPAVRVSMAGGLVADDEDLTPDADRPVVARAVTVRVDDWLDGAASASWSRVREAPAAREAEGETQRDVLDAAARVLVIPTDTTWAFASLDLADVASWTVPPDDPRTWSATAQGFALTQIYGQAGYRPVRPLRLDVGWIWQASRFAAVDSTDHFQDASGRVRWRFAPGMQAMARGRARVRDRRVVDGEVEATQAEISTRAQAAIDASDLFDLGLAVNVGALHDRSPSRNQTALTGEAGWQGIAGHAFGGFRTTLRDPDDTFSTFTPDEPGATVALDPYSRTVEMAAFGRAALQARWGYVQASVDYDLQAAQWMAFTQTGVVWR